MASHVILSCVFFFQAEDGIRDYDVTGVQTCALPICRRPEVRIRLLVLAAVAAAYGSLDRIAAHCRQLVLEHNPRHMIGRWETVEIALAEEDFLHFLRHLERRYPLEQAEQMLTTLGIALLYVPDRMSCL